MRKLIKRILVEVLALIFFALYPLLKNLYLKRGLVVFCYHDVSESPSEFSRQYNLNVEPEIFAKQIDILKKIFNFLSPSNFTNSEKIKNRSMMTFDDGFRSVLENAVPILENNDIAAVIFLNFNTVKGKPPWPAVSTYMIINDGTQNYDRQEQDDLFLEMSKEKVEDYFNNSEESKRKKLSIFSGEYLDEKDLRRIELKHSAIKLGNHLYNHYSAKKLTEEELKDQYMRNEKHLKDYDNYCNYFAFPFGQPDKCFTSANIILLKNLGAGKIFTTYPVINSFPERVVLHRIALLNSDNTKRRIIYRIFITQIKRLILPK